MRESRILDPTPVRTLADHRAVGGGLGLARARQSSREEIIATLDAAGVRGRGGAGFPTGAKWRTVADHASGASPTTVVVNGAEGEPGSFKDRHLLRTNPFRVIEGAAIAAHAFEARAVVIAIEGGFDEEAGRLRDAIDEMVAAGWLDHVSIDVFAGPDHYLYGEETGLLEALDGRPPFPRVAPPWRRGIVEVAIDDTAEPTAETAGLTLGAEGRTSPVPPALVNNVETLCHVAAILAHGPEWFREVGTEDSPGTVVCTITGSTRNHGVGEFAMGTPLSSVIDELGGGPRSGRSVRAALSGVANPLLIDDDLDTPLTYEDMRALGNGLGAAGFIVFDDGDDLVEVISGAVHFLAIESCGQCQPCKSDGLALDHLVADVAGGVPLDDHTRQRLERLRSTVTDGARCNLAHQILANCPMQAQRNKVKRIYQ